MDEARLLQQAIATFGSEEKARAWLCHQHSLLGNRSPLEISRTEAGAQIVANMLARIACGAAV
jgi:putative toxin-antitoxin system antitoxin component (TIGR02293 family)